MPTPERPVSERAELKPCPFCGGEAKYDIVPADEESPNTGGHYVACSSCGASTTLWFPLKESVTELVREAWNRRAALADGGRGEPDEVAAKVLEGFERGFFVRSTTNDADPAWAIKLFPYLRALAQLQRARRPPHRGGAR